MSSAEIAATPAKLLPLIGSRPAVVNVLHGPHVVSSADPTEILRLSDVVLVGTGVIVETLVAVPGSAVTAGRAVLSAWPVGVPHGEPIYRMMSVLLPGSGLEP